MNNKSTMEMVVPENKMACASEATATSPDEMADAQAGMIVFFEHKVRECEGDSSEALHAYEHAVKQKWSSSALKRICDKTTKRLTFYRKVLAALKNGFVIIPNFPVTAFAIRTNKKYPLKMYSTRNDWQDNREQAGESRQAGEGEYQNPFPQICSTLIEKETPTSPAKKNYWAESFEDMEFPVVMAKPRIMEVTTRAMALKIFDDLAVLPEDAKKCDPVIVGRIYDGSHANPYGTRKHVTFLIAWYLDLKVI